MFPSRDPSTIQYRSITTPHHRAVRPERNSNRRWGTRVNCQCYEYIYRAPCNSITLILQMLSRSMHALVFVSGKRRTAGPGIVLNLSPRIVLFLDRLTSFGTIPGNLQERLNKQPEDRKVEREQNAHDRPACTCSTSSQGPSSHSYLP